MLSPLHRTSLVCSPSVIVPVKHHVAQPLGLEFWRPHGRVSQYVTATLKTGSGQGSMGYWLLKTEPGEWGWEHQERNGGISNWDGVRNALAQIHLRSMRLGDHAFFYHSGKGPAVVGVVEVVKAAYPDASDDTGKSCMVDVRALAAFPQPVPLSVIKSDDAMRDWILLRQSRLSVMPVSPDVWQRVCDLGELSPPLCRTTTENEDNNIVEPTEPERVAQPKRRKRGEAKAGAQTKSTKQKTHGAEETANHELEQLSEQFEVASVAELKTYRRSSRQRIAPVEPSVVKTYKSRGEKKLPGDDTTLNPKP